VERFTGALAGITFRDGTATLRGAATPVLDEAVAVLERYPDLRVRIVGHTDDRGDSERNLDLSRRRADAVRDYLVSKGVAPERLETEGRGDAAPLVPNTTRENRAKNRRIEFVIE